MKRTLLLLGGAAALANAGSNKPDEENTESETTPAPQTTSAPQSTLPVVKLVKEDCDDNYKGAIEKIAEYSPELGDLTDNVVLRRADAFCKVVDGYLGIDHRYISEEEFLDLTQGKKPRGFEDETQFKTFLKELSDQIKKKHPEKKFNIILAGQESTLYPEDLDFKEKKCGKVQRNFDIEVYIEFEDENVHKFVAPKEHNKYDEIENLKNQQEVIWTQTHEYFELKDLVHKYNKDLHLASVLIKTLRVKFKDHYKGGLFNRAFTYDPETDKVTQDSWQGIQTIQ